MHPGPQRIWQLDTAHIGRHVLCFDQLESTNTTALQLADTQPSGFVVIADHQTAGRGQYGRVWQARRGSSLLMSVALRPPQEMGRAVTLTALASVAVGDAILALTGLQARIKWPNDLLIHGKKVCGILIERHADTAVIGIGLNVTQSVDELAAAGLSEATSLGIVAATTVELEQAAEAAIRCLDHEYGRLLAGERVAVEADWKWRIGLLGRTVVAELTDGMSIVGRLKEMSFDSLCVDAGNGTAQRIAPERVRQLRQLPDSL